MIHPDDLNDPVLTALAQERADATGSGWTLGQPPDDGRIYETRVSPGGAWWWRVQKENTDDR